MTDTIQQRIGEVRERLDKIADLVDARQRAGVAERLDPVMHTLLLSLTDVTSIMRDLDRKVSNVEQSANLDSTG
jgi:methyl-accepting chemotaxis protein